MVTTIAAMTMVMISSIRVKPRFRRFIGNHTRSVAWFDMIIFGMRMNF